MPAIEFDATDCLMVENSGRFFSFVHSSFRSLFLRRYYSLEFSLKNGVKREKFQLHYCFVAYSLDGLLTESVDTRIDCYVSGSGS
jgi:hypothetical protein